MDKRKRTDTEIEDSVLLDFENSTAALHQIAVDQKSIHDEERLSQEKQGLGKLVRNKRIKTPRGRLNEYIRKDAMQALREGDIEEEDAPESLTPFKMLLMEAEEKQLEFAPLWSDVWGTENQFFIFENKLAGNYSSFKSFNATSDMLDLFANTLSPEAAKHFKEIGLSLPFAEVSLFFTHEKRFLLKKSEFILVSFNSDVTKAHQYIKDDEENGKVAYNPYFVLMDKFTAEFLKTGATGPLFSYAKTEKDNVPRIAAYTHLICYLMADIYPEDHSSHQEAMEIRRQLIFQTNKAFVDRENAYQLALAVQQQLTLKQENKSEKDADIPIGERH